ncbi:MAG: SDR family oxidoreductase [Verrucomicrobiota bacterium]
MKLENKVAIVTGGARGIGLGCAEALAEEGARLLIADRPGSNELGVTVEKLRASGAECHGVEADAFTRQGCQSIISAANEQFGDIDILVHVPGYNRRDSFLDYDPEAWAGVVNAVLHGPFHMSQLFARELVRRAKPGKITFITSVLGTVPSARSSAYGPAKAALDHLTRIIAVELFEHQINVNAIAPGWIDTPGERDHYDDETMAAEGAKLPWKRLGRSDEIGKAAAFLSSPDADYITGTILPVDGGYLVRHGAEIPDERD